MNTLKRRVYDLLEEIEWCARVGQDADAACPVCEEWELHGVHAEGCELSALLEELACAACGAFAEGNCTVHRDGFGKGPEVPLCDACGLHPDPTLTEIWASIRARRGGA